MFTTLVHIRVLDFLVPRIKQGFPLGSGDKLVSVRRSQEEGCLDITFYINHFAVRKEQAEWVWRFYEEAVTTMTPITTSENGGKTVFQFWTSASLPPVQYVQALVHPSWHQRLRAVEGL